MPIFFSAGGVNALADVLFEIYIAGLNCQVGYAAGTMRVNIHFAVFNNSNHTLLVSSLCNSPKFCICV